MLLVMRERIFAITMDEQRMIFVGDPVEYLPPLHGCLRRMNWRAKDNPL